VVSIASRLPDIELLPGDGPPRVAPPAPPPPWRAPPPPEIELIGAPRERAGRRLLGQPRQARGPRRTIWPQPARRPPAPAPRLAAPVAASPPPPAPRAVAAELEIPAFLARPRPAVAAAVAAPAAPPVPIRHGPRPRPRAARPRLGRIAATGAALAALAAAALVALAGAGGSEGPLLPPAPSPVPAVAAAAAAEIPPDYLALYRQFGLEMDIDWRFLAAIGAQESDHGRNPWAARVNAEGCVGPMQLGVGGRCGNFVGAWGVDGDGDGRVNPLDPADAIATAARGLRLGKGAPPRGGDFEGYRRAACGYYGACADARADYADEVMARAVRYGFPQ
jgi:hypothetical protein